MSFAAPWSLLGLLAVPAIVLLHLYRRRLPDRRVAAVFLFAGERLAADAGRQRTRLLRTPSLWLECLAAALLALWLAGPSFGGVASRHVVFVLDDSASMAAGETMAQTVADVAARAAELASDDRVTVLRTGPRAEVLLGPRALPQEVSAALAAWRPARPGHDAGPALDLGRELAAGGGEVVFCTDHVPVAGNDDVLVVAHGAPAPNAAILSAQRFVRADGSEDLRVQIAGFAGAERTELTVTSGGMAMARRPIELTAGPAQLSLALPPGTGIVQLQLRPDALAIDDAVFLLPEPLRTVAVCDLLPPDRRNQLSLARAIGSLDGIRAESDPLAAQLLFVAEPGSPIAGQTEVVLASGDAARHAYQGPFVIERSHPWLAGVQLQGVVWFAEERALPGQVLVAAGDHALVSEEFLDLGRRLWISIDASAGNLVRAPDWPVLLANIVDGCRSSVPGPERVHVLVGGEARYRRTLIAGAEDAEPVLVGPDGSERRGTGVGSVGWPIDAPGLYTVRGRSGRELGAFAARFFDAAESDLQGHVTKVVPARERGPMAEAEAAARDTSFERRVLALLLGLALVLDWWWLHGRSWRGRA